MKDLQFSNIRAHSGYLAEDTRRESAGSVGISGRRDAGGGMREMKKRAEGEGGRGGWAAGAARIILRDNNFSGPFSFGMAVSRDAP